MGCILFAKVLTRRLSKVAGFVFDEAKQAFMAGVSILDASLIVNKMVALFLGKGDQGVLWKLDVEKTYDHFS